MLARVCGRSRSAWGVRRASILGAFILGWALLCNSVLESLQHLALFRLSFDPSQVLPFTVGTLILCIFMTLLLCLTGRPWWSAGLMLSVSATAAVANAEKLQLRYEPVYPGDVIFVPQGGSFLAMLGWRPLAGCLLVVAALPCIVFLVRRRLHAAIPRLDHYLGHQRTPRARRSRAMIGLLCLLAVFELGRFEDPGNPFRWAYTNAGAKWDGAAQADMYLHNGFVGGTLANLRPQAMARPKHYNERTMRSLLARYTAAAARINRHRDHDVLENLNVVVILSESFGGTRHIAGAAPSVDPIPFTHQLQTQATSGRMLAQGYGGGTANAEFEALTGLSMSQLSTSMTYPYSMLIARRQSFPSAVAYFKAQGHDAIAIHPFTPGYYSRNRVYPALGFDSFISAAQLDTKVRLTPRSFISDESAFEEVESLLATHSRPAFVHLVSIQNHPTYADVYPDPVPLTGIDGWAAKLAGNYMRGLAHTDDALRHLIQHLRSSPEPTAVVFFGDHQPGFWPDKVWQSSGYRAMHQTPFWIWTNLAHQQPDQRPTTSPVYFLPMLLDQVNAPIPAFYALLEELRSFVPAMDGGLLIGADDQETTEAALPPAAKALLRDYRLVEYDLTDGEGYIAKQLFEPVSSD